MSTEPANSLNPAITRIYDRGMCAFDELMHDVVCGNIATSSAPEVTAGLTSLCTYADQCDALVQAESLAYGSQIAENVIICNGVSCYRALYTE